jgi:hypothetical protein
MHQENAIGARRNKQLEQERLHFKDISAIT